MPGAFIINNQAAGTLDRVFPDQRTFRVSCELRIHGAFREQQGLRLRRVRHARWK